MRTLLLLICLALPTPSSPQDSAKPASVQASPASRQQALTAALLGQWTGILEYRDYSEPADSAKRVQLPTWLTIRPAPEGVFFDYVYDDGPTKIVTEHNTLVLELAQARYRVMGTDAVLEQYAIAGAENLKDGHGVLILTGPGKDSGKPANRRITWTIRRNLLSWEEEVRPAGSNEPFVFRHRYTFTRAQSPATGTTDGKK